MRRSLTLMTAAALAFTGCGTESQRIDPKAGSANSDPSTTDPGKDWLAGVSPNTLATVAAPLRDAAASMDIETHISRSGIDDTESRFNTSIFVPKGILRKEGFRSSHWRIEPPEPRQIAHRPSHRLFSTWHRLWPRC